jgi:hypothetical protein
MARLPGDSAPSASPPDPRSPTVNVIDAIARILKTEGAEFLSAYPTTPLIEFVTSEETAFAHRRALP